MITRSLDPNLTTNIMLPLVLTRERMFLRELTGIHMDSYMKSFQEDQISKTIQVTLKRKSVIKNSGIMIHQLLLPDF